jgi:hypothetical protein
MKVYRKFIIISPDPCISVKNLSTSFRDSWSRRIFISSALDLDPKAFKTLLKIPEADIHGFDDLTANSISCVGSPAKYLNLEREILISLSWINLDPPLPETPVLNSLQLSDSYKIHDLDWLKGSMLIDDILSPDFFDVAVISCAKNADFLQI